MFPTSCGDNFFARVGEVEVIGKTKKKYIERSA